MFLRQKHVVNSLMKLAPGVYQIGITGKVSTCDLNISGCITRCVILTVSSSMSNSIGLRPYNVVLHKGLHCFIGI